MTPLIIDWNYILNTALIGFLLVFMVLILMVFIMQAMGKGFKQNKQKQPADKVKLEDEKVAAITTALKIFQSNLHDKESEVITIHKIKSVYSPWSSKIHGLTQLPDHKRK